MISSKKRTGAEVPVDNSGERITQTQRGNDDDDESSSSGSEHSSRPHTVGGGVTIPHLRAQPLAAVLPVQAQSKPDAAPEVQQQLLQQQQQQLQQQQQQQQQQQDLTRSNDSLWTLSNFERIVAEKAIKAREKLQCDKFKLLKNISDDPEKGRMNTEYKIENISVCTACFLWKNSTESDISSMVALSAAGIKGHRCRRKDPCIASTGADQTRTIAVKENTSICVTYRFDPPVFISAKVAKYRNEFGALETKEIRKSIAYSNSKDGDQVIHQAKEVFEFQRVGLANPIASERNVYTELRCKIPAEVVQQLRNECQHFEHNSGVKWEPPAAL